MKNSTFMATLIMLFVISVATSSYASKNVQEKFKLENEHLIVSVGENNLFTLTDKKTGVIWHPDPWKGTTGEIKVTYPANLFNKQAAENKTGYAGIDINEAREVICRRKGPRTVQWISSGFTVKGQPIKGRVAFEVKLAEDKPVVEIELTELEFERKEIAWHSFHFLPRWFSLRVSSDSGYVVVPKSQGFIFPVGDSGLDRLTRMSEVWEFGQRPFSEIYNRPNFCFYGAVNRNSALMVRFENSNDTHIQFHGNQKPSENTPRISSAYPLILPSMGELGYSRKFWVEIIPNGSYVDMARRYRGWLKARGLYRSLKEKIRELPAVEKLVGTPIVFATPGYLKVSNSPEENPRNKGGMKISGTGTFKDISDMMRRIKAEGVNRAYIQICGWSYKSPEHWPPNPVLGGVTGLKKVFSRELRKEFPEYILGLYTVYNDMPLSAPSYDVSKVLMNADKSPNVSGFWSVGLTHVLCPTQYRSFAEKDFDAMQSELELLDCMLYDNVRSRRECYNPNHPLTRTEAAEARYDFLKWTVSRGLITGVEFGQDWYAPYIHYCDGAVGAYGKIPWGSKHENIVPVPLWDIIFHDSLVTYWWHWNNYVFSSSYVMNRGYEWKDMVLQDILCANPGTWSMCPDNVDYWSKIMGQIAPIQSRIAGSLAHV
ncbi:MAG: hypothetical protein KAT56_06960, partial [Sedimentisphaerales bacterium]|nr:hypothetical protein [Sedimentisphaerales bacterium]